VKVTLSARSKSRSPSKALAKSSGSNIYESKLGHSVASTKLGTTGFKGEASYLRRSEAAHK